MEKTQTQHAVREQSWLYTIIRIYPHEFSRTFIVWIIRFLYRFAFVVSWTLVVAHVASVFHAETALPLLFLFHALLVLAGSIFSLLLFRRFQLENIFLGSIIAGVILLVFSQFILHTDFLRTGVLLFVEAFLLVQLSINIETFTERLFTPLESSRTFPVVESGDTVATLLAGSFLFFYAESLSLERGIWIVIIALSILVPLFLQYHFFVRSLPGICLFRRQLIGTKTSHADGHEKGMGHSAISRVIRKHPYVFTLIIIVLAQWFFAVSLEYLFTYSVSLETLSQGELIPAAAGAVENVLVHEFGLLQIILATVALFSNLFLTGRILSSFGIVGSVLLHPLVSLLSLAAMVINFGYFTTVLSRINAEITGVIYRNAYQSSYYVFEESESQFTRVFLDGIIRPIGSLLGTFFLLFAHFAVSSAYLVTFILVGLFVVLLSFMLATMRLQKQYVHLVISQLSNPDVDFERKISLLDVASQNHFAVDSPYILTLYRDSGDAPLLRVSLLRLFAERREHLHLIFDALHDTHVEVRFGAVDALQILFSSHFFDEQLLSRQELISILKKCYIDESDKDLRFMILMLLARVHDSLVLQFLLDLLHDERGELLSDVLLACDAFGDPSFLPLIEPFLDSEDPRVWTSAVSVLGKHDAYRSKIRKCLDQHLHEDSQGSRIAVAFCLISFQDRFYIPYLIERFSLSTLRLERLLVAFALVQHDYDHSLEQFCEEIFAQDVRDSEKILRLVACLPFSKRRYVELITQQHAMKHLHSFLRQPARSSVSDLTEADLLVLRNLYAYLHSTEDIVVIDEVLRQKYHVSCSTLSHFGFLPFTLSSYV